MLFPEESFSKELRKFSNPEVAQQKAFDYLGDDAILYESTSRNKKYQIYDPYTEKWIHFGQMGYKDYTKHGNEQQRENYLARSAGIKGNWRSNEYSPNNLSRNILW